MIRALLLLSSLFICNIHSLRNLTLEYDSSCPHSNQIRCSNGRCISEFVYSRTGCIACNPNYENQCPDGSCVSRFDDVQCPKCRPHQVQCSDGQCVEENKTCESCVQGERRCATGECINATAATHCSSPCFHFEVVCKDSTCRSSLHDCPCLAHEYQCNDGKCLLDWHQCSEGKTFMIWYILGSGAFITVGIIAVYYGTRQIQSRRRRHLHPHERYSDRRLLTGSTSGHSNQGVLLDAERQHIVYQSVPSHYPVPVGAEAPEPVVQGNVNFDDVCGLASEDEEQQAMALMGNIQSDK